MGSGFDIDQRLYIYGNIWASQVCMHAGIGKLKPAGKWRFKVFQAIAILVCMQGSTACIITHLHTAAYVYRYLGSYAISPVGYFSVWRWGLITGRVSKNMRVLWIFTILLSFRFIGKYIADNIRSESLIMRIELLECLGISKKVVFHMKVFSS